MLREDGVNASNVTEMLSETQKKSKAFSKAVKISFESYEKYFKGNKPDAIVEIVENALVAWFKGKGIGSV